jgi:hypothetical protein
MGNSGWKFGNRSPYCLHSLRDCRRNSQVFSGKFGNDDPQHISEHPPSIELAHDFFNALVARYESQEANRRCGIARSRAPAGPWISGRQRPTLFRQDPNPVHIFLAACGFASKCHFLRRPINTPNPRPITPSNIPQSSICPGTRLERAGLYGFPSSKKPPKNAKWCAAK